jgi:hypothetical protein
MRCITCGKVQKSRKKRHCWEASQQCATCHYLGKKSTGRGHRVPEPTFIGRDIINNVD